MKIEHEGKCEMTIRYSGTCLTGVTCITAKSVPRKTGLQAFAYFDAINSIDYLVSIVGVGAEGNYPFAIYLTPSGACPNTVVGVMTKIEPTGKGYYECT